MKRTPINSDILSMYVGKVISEQHLMGRGYVYIENGSVVTNSNPKIADNISYDEQFDDEEDSITCNKVKDYLATQVDNYYLSCWVKCIAAETEDVDNEEVYMIVCVETEDSDGCIRIDNACNFASKINMLNNACYDILQNIRMLSIPIPLVNLAYMCQK